MASDDPVSSTDTGQPTGNTRRPWFGSNGTGLSYHPQTWQGWATLLAVVAVIVILVVLFRTRVI